MRSRSPRLAVLFLSLVITGAARPILTAQSTPRELYVSVLDERGDPVKNLQADAFIVREDGVPREVLRVRPATDPLQLAIVVDNSEVSRSEIPNIREGLHAFLKELPATNDITLVTVADRPTILVDYTSHREEIEKGIDRIFTQPNSGSSLLEALVEVSKGLEKRPSSRPVIVLISLEGPEFSTMHYDYVLGALRKSAAAVHAIVVTHPGADITSDPARTRSIVLNRGTESGGGRQSLLLSSQGLADTLRHLAAELSNQYVVTYSRPDTLIPPEKVDVAVKQPNFKARGVPVPTPSTP